MNKLIIFGEDILAEMAKFYFDNDSDYTVCGFVADACYISSKNEYLGLPLVKKEEVLNIFPPEEYRAFVAIGFSDMNRNREEKIREFKDMGYRMATYISSSVICWDRSAIGTNCMIMEGVIIQPFCRIADGCMLSSGVKVNHGCVLEENVFMGSNAAIGGGVHIGRNSFVGINAAVRDHVQVAEFSLIGAGAYISKNTRPYGLYGTNSTKDVTSGMDEEMRKKTQTSLL